MNIDVRLVDLQNMKLQQNNGHPDWSSLDPLDRHIRKLESSIDRVRFIFNLFILVQIILNNSVQKSKQVLRKHKFIECRWINCSCQRRRQQVAALKLICLIVFFWLSEILFIFFHFSLYQQLIHQLNEVQHSHIQLLMHPWVVMVNRQ